MTIEADRRAPPLFWPAASLRQSTAKFYDESNLENEIKTADTYRTAVSSFFRPRIQGHETWSIPLWSNEPAVSHPHK